MDRGSKATKAGVEDMVFEAATSHLDCAMYEAMSTKTRRHVRESSGNLTHAAHIPIEAALSLDLESGTRQKEDAINGNT